MKKNEMPKSCLTVFENLKENEERTTKDLILATGLAPRTVRFALRRLKEEGLILEKFNFRDARQMLYSLNTSTTDVGTASA